MRLQIIIRLFHALLIHFLPLELLPYIRDEYQSHLRIFRNK